MHELRQQLHLAALLRRTKTGDHDERQVFDPTYEVRKPTQRRCVCPVQVVDREHRRPAQRGVRSEPVEAVQHRERDVVAACALDPLGEADVVEER